MSNEKHDSSLAQTMAVAYVGTTGTGKTTETLKHAKRLGGRILVVIDNPTVQGWDDIKPIDPNSKESFNFSGVRKIYFDDYGAEIVWNAIHKSFRNGSLILDDAAMYVEPNWNHNESLKKVIIQHRHISIDIFFVVHQFNDLPPKLWGYLKFLYISKLTSIPKKSDIKVANPSKLIAVAEEVNTRIALFERSGGSAWGQFYCYQNF